MDEQEEPSAADRALAAEVAELQRKISRLEHDAEQANGFVQQAIDQLNWDRQNEDEIRARLALTRQQLYTLTHPAKGVYLGDDGLAVIRRVLEENAHHALQGRR